MLLLVGSRQFLASSMEVYGNQVSVAYWVKFSVLDTTTICYSIPPQFSWTEEKGLGTIEWFLGCAESAVLIFNVHWWHACMAYGLFHRLTHTLEWQGTISLACPNSRLL